jgi:hypothetical protein
MPTEAMYSVKEQGHSEGEISGVATPGSRDKMGSNVKILNEEI